MIHALRYVFLIVIFIPVLLPVCGSAQEEDSDSFDTEVTDFDIPEVDKKPYSFSAELEVSENIKGYDNDSLLFYQKFPDGTDKDTFFQTDFNLKAEGDYTYDIVKLYTRLNGTLYYNEDEHWETDFKAEEAYVSFQQSPAFSLDIGKKVFKWGKGYAWNPTAFFSRPKNLEDPDATLEGFYAVSSDMIKSMDGPLKTIAFTPVIMPVSDHLNDDWESETDVIFGGKIYFFTCDTDIDFMFLYGSEVPDRFGLDFSKNIFPNFEIHGEAAIVKDYVKYITDRQGNLTEKKYNAISYLFGIRYLSSMDTTTIFEYYRNGKGYTSDEFEDYFSLIETGYSQYHNSGQMNVLMKSRLHGKYYNRQTAMKDYLYLKVSQKEPFDILYFTPSVTAIYNINDKSGSIASQITYTPITNLEFDLKATFLLGSKYTEYGEKVNDYNITASVKYYF